VILSETPPSLERPALLRYGGAVLAVALSVLIRLPLQPLLGGGVPFLFFFPAIVAASWYGGLGPGLLATALSTLTADYLFLPPVYSFGLPNLASGVQAALFAAIGVFISLLNERLHGARRAAQSAALEILRREEELRRARSVASESEERLRILAEREELRRSLDLQRQDHEELEVMNRIGRVLTAELDRERLVQSLTDEATQALHAQFGSFFYNVVEENKESYVLYTLSGVPREAFSQFPMPRNTEVFGPTFRGEGIVRGADITRDPRYGRNAPYHGMPEGHLPVRSYLAASVISRSGEVLGGLFFGHEEVGVFGEREERILAGVAVQAAIALDNATLFRQAESSREAAEAASRSKDEFLATVSHELRTPLNAILGWAQLLMSDGADAQRRERGLETIVRNAKLQSQLIDDLLDVSRIVSGNMRLDVQPTGLVTVIDAAVAAVGPAAEAKQITLRKVLDPLAGPVSGDPARLQQVVWNLLSNAVKFTPKEGKVEVRLERVNSHLEIIVADNGIGISPEFLPQVFDRFRQLDSSTTRHYGGLGLGLAIVRHLVELHGGTVRVESPGPGQGTTFVVLLPLSIAHLSSADRRRVHPQAGLGPSDPCRDDPTLDLRGIRVLVVDDEPDARETLQQILEHCNAEVATASSAREALDLLPRWRPHVLLSDIGMAGEDGYDLIRQVRALPAESGGQTPAAALTAFARGEDRLRTLHAGFQLHVPKPVDIRELAAVVASLARGTKLGATPVVRPADPPSPPG
jgi:signal transduction histidine kinase/CheY-like chemotaxis protein